MNQDVKNLTDDERISRIADHIGHIIELLGEDTAREGLLKTPARAAKALYYLTSGYRSDAAGTLSSALFEHEGSKVVTVRDIEFYSMCEHHILPFFGKISVAYVPGDKIVGLSKLARVVDICARKLQVQERLTREARHRRIHPRVKGSPCRMRRPTHVHENAWRRKAGIVNRHHRL